MYVCSDCETRAVYGPDKTIFKNLGFIKTVLGGGLRVVRLPSSLTYSCELLSCVFVFCELCRLPQIL